MRALTVKRLERQLWVVEERIRYCKPEIFAGLTNRELQQETLANLTRTDAAVLPWPDSTISTIYTNDNTLVQYSNVDDEIRYLTADGFAFDQK